MKKLFIGLAALFVLLSFSGCKNDVSTAILEDVFYTRVDPHNYYYETIKANCPKTTTVNSGEDIWLVAYISDPDAIVDYLQISYLDKVQKIEIPDSHDSYVIYPPDSWTASSTSSVSVSFRLVCKDGTVSNGKTINLTIKVN